LLTFHLPPCKNIFSPRNPYKLFVTVGAIAIINIENVVAGREVGNVDSKVFPGGCSDLFLPPELAEHVYNKQPGESGRSLYQGEIQLIRIVSRNNINFIARAGAFDSGSYPMPVFCITLIAVSIAVTATNRVKFIVGARKTGAYG
jgi:hypothetical protein